MLAWSLFFPPLLDAAPLLGRVNDLWFALPLIIAVSLVYAGTRHEKNESILRHALSVGGWIVGFMGTILAVLALLGWWSRS